MSQMTCWRENCSQWFSPIRERIGSVNRFSWFIGGKVRFTWIDSFTRVGGEEESDKKDKTTSTLTLSKSNPNFRAVWWCFRIKYAKIIFICTKSWIVDHCAFKQNKHKWNMITRSHTQTTFSFLEICRMYNRFMSSIICCVSFTLVHRFICLSLAWGSI